MNKSALEQTTRICIHRSEEGGERQQLLQNKNNSFISKLERNNKIEYEPGCSQSGGIILKTKQKGNKKKCFY